MERPSTGEVWVDDQNLTTLPYRRIPLLRRKFGVVHQNHQLLFDRNVYDNVALPLIVAGYHPRDVGRRVPLHWKRALARSAVQPLSARPLRRGRR